MSKLKSLLTTENLYNFVVQMDYLMGLLTATVLGLCLAGDTSWYLFICLLGASLGLGIITVKVYIKVFKGFMRGKHGDSDTAKIK